MISDFPLVKRTCFCSISLKSKVTSGKLETTLIKKVASNKIEPGEVTNKPAFSSLIEIKFSIEIWPFDPDKATPSGVTSILIVERIGIAFFELIALLVVFSACKNKVLLIEKFIIVIPFIYFMISKLIVIVGCVEVVENSQNPIYDLKSYLFKNCA